MLEVKERWIAKEIIYICIFFYILKRIYRTLNTAQWKEFQRKIKNALGRTWTEHALKACVMNLWNRDKLPGHKRADFCDPRYTALLHYAKQHLPDNSEVKVNENEFARGAAERSRS